ncbi:MAG TPA: response regulator [Nitrospiria bacterium]|nr:response regulator [Nitrospiria bacterium]
MSVQVLVVDQNPVIQTAIENILAPYHLEVISVRDALSGLDLAYKTVPAVILSEFNPEGLMIHSFCARIRQKAAIADVPIYILLQKSDAADEAKLKQSGVTGVIPKPVDPIRLLEIMKPFMPAPVAASPMPDATVFEIEAEPDATDFLDSTVVEAMSEADSLEPPEVPLYALNSGVPGGMDDDSATQVQYGEDPLGLDQTAFDSSLLDQTVLEPSAPPADLMDLSSAGTPFSEVISSTPSNDQDFGAETTIMDNTKGLDLSSLSGDSEKTRFAPEPPPAPVSSQNGKHLTSGVSLEESEAISDAAREIIEKVAWEVVPHLTEQALKSNALSTMIEKILWEVLPHVAQKQIQDAIQKLTEEEKLT